MSAPVTGHDAALVAALVGVRDRIVRRLMAKADDGDPDAPRGDRLTGPQHVTLDALGLGPLTVGDVAAATGVAVSTATRMIQGLERQGLVADAHVPDTDRRRRHVELTETGRSALAEQDAAIADRARRMIATLTPAERGDLLRGLVVMSRALATPYGDEPADADPHVPEDHP